MLNLYNNINDSNKNEGTSLSLPFRRADDCASLGNEEQNYFQFKRNQLTAGIYFLQIKSKNLNVDTMKLIFK
jgi:hypothetical protein